MNHFQSEHDLDSERKSDESVRTQLVSVRFQSSLFSILHIIISKG